MRPQTTQRMRNFYDTLDMPETDEFYCAPSTICWKRKPMHTPYGKTRAALAASVLALFGHATCSAATPDAPAVYAVDSSNALLAYDAAGKRLGSMQFPAELGRLNGGIALALGNVYVTWNKPRSMNPPEPEKSGVYAYDRMSLKPVRLHIGAFRPGGAEVDPGAMHAIVYDSGTERFYVATERLGLLEFNNAGVPVPRASESRQSIASVAYDSDRHTLWSIVDRQTVDRFDEVAGVSLPGLPAIGSRLGHGNGVLALAVCAGNSSGVAAVAFGNLKAATGSLRVFDAEGKSIETPRKIARPNAMSCSLSGELLVATDKGLMKYGLRSSTLPSSVEWEGLSPPVYGAMTAY
jgi:hypothetical protein